MPKKPFNPDPNMLASAAEKDKESGGYTPEYPRLSDNHLQEIMRRTGLCQRSAEACQGILIEYIRSSKTLKKHLTPGELQAQLQNTCNKILELEKYIESLHWETKDHIDIKLWLSFGEDSCLSTFEKKLENLWVAALVAERDAPPPQKGKHQPKAQEVLYRSCHECLKKAGINCGTNAKDPLPLLVSILLEAAGEEPKPLHRSIKRFLENEGLN